jgi:hypothetical protein
VGAVSNGEGMRVSRRGGESLHSTAN